MRDERRSSSSEKEEKEHGDGELSLDVVYFLRARVNFELI